jgi:hypothetical protein
MRFAIALGLFTSCVGAVDVPTPPPVEQPPSSPGGGGPLAMPSSPDSGCTLALSAVSPVSVELQPGAEADVAVALSGDCHEQLAHAQVTFAIDGAAHGAQVLTPAVTTDSQGIAQTRVRAGDASFAVEAGFAELKVRFSVTVSALPAVDRASVVSSSLPAQLACGAQATGSVMMKNTGTTMWAGADYSLSGIALTGPVGPGASAVFQLPLHAMATGGVLQVHAQMQHGPTAFGDAFSKGVAVTCGCAFPQGLPESDFLAYSGSATDTDPLVDDAVNAAMVEVSGCAALSSCDLSSFPGADVGEQCQSYFAAVTQKLRDHGFCAGQHEIGSTDEIAVSNTGCTGKWFGYHVCYYGGPKVVWNPGARRGWWKIEPSRCAP